MLLFCIQAGEQALECLTYIHIPMLHPRLAHLLQRSILLQQEDQFLVWETFSQQPQFTVAGHHGVNLVRRLYQLIAGTQIQPAHIVCHLIFNALRENVPQLCAGLHRLTLCDPLHKKLWHIDDLCIVKCKVAAVADLQRGEFMRRPDQLRRASRRYFLLPAIPAVLLPAGCEFKEDIVLRYKLGITAELTCHAVVGLAFAHDRLLHVRFHFLQVDTEPAFHITEAAYHAVLQNAVQVFFLRQVIDL